MNGALTTHFLNPENHAIRCRVLAKIGSEFAKLEGDADECAVARELVEIGAVEVRLTPVFRGMSDIVSGSIVEYRRT